MRVDLDDAYRMWRSRSSDATRATADGQLIQDLAEEARKLHSALNWVGCCSACKEEHHWPDLCPRCIALEALSPPPTQEQPRTVS